MYFHYRLQFCQGFPRRKTFKWMYASQGQKNIQIGSGYNPQPNAFSFHFVFKGNFLSTIFLRWHKSEYFVQKITNRINSDLLRFPPMKQPQPGGCIRRQIQNLGQYQPSPFQLLQYQWWEGRFDTLGKLVSAHPGGGQHPAAECCPRGGWVALGDTALYF